ncbi:MAG TPA: cytochrome P450 [Solirubrobacteraceae bacterium]|nr:cytochrome P450 [Solirubrobacteraceae bacterium]
MTGRIPRAEDFPLGAATTLADLEEDPHPRLALLRVREPVSWVPALGGWLVTSHDLALEVMRDAGRFTVDDPRFSTAQVVGPSMLSLDGPEHERHRRPFGAPFRPLALRERFAALVAADADRLIDAFAGDSGTAELRSAFAGPLATLTIARALGLAPGEVADLLGWYEAIVASVTEITGGGPVSARGARAFAQLRARLQEVIADREHSSLLRDAATSWPLSPEEIVSNAGVLLFGGIETTEGMILNALSRLLADRKWIAAAAEPASLGLCVEESLRLEPAATMVDRYATTEVRLGPALISAGELVHVSISGANRDPRVFPDPDRFDPARGNVRRHLAFAHGPHVCLGVHLARLEATVGVGVLLRRLADLRLASTAPPAARGLVFRKPAELLVNWG